MQAFGVLWDADKSRQHAEGMGIFASRRMGLARFHDPCMYIQASFPRLVVCGRGLKTILLLLYFPRMVLFRSSNCRSEPNVSHMRDNGQHTPQRVCSPHVTTPGLPKTPSAPSVTSLTTALRSHHHSAGAKTRHPTCIKVYGVDKYGAAVWTWSNSHFRGSSDCASGITSAWGTLEGPPALYPAAALIPVPQEGKHGTESRREGGDSACDGTQRKADHSELPELEITEVILYSSTRERILYLAYTIC